MKRFITLILLACLVLSLTGCGGGKVESFLSANYDKIVLYNSDEKQAILEGENTKPLLEYLSSKKYSSTINPLKDGSYKLIFYSGENETDVSLTSENICIDGEFYKVKDKLDCDKIREMFGVQ